MNQFRQPNVRMAACCDGRAGEDTYGFYLVNEGGETVSSIKLREVELEWGDESRFFKPSTHIDDLAKGASALVYRDDGEFRITLKLVLTVAPETWRVEFSFPKLYRQVRWLRVDTVGEKCLYGEAAWMRNAAK